MGNVAIQAIMPSRTAHPTPRITARARGAPSRLLIPAKNSATENRTTPSTYSLARWMSVLAYQAWTYYTFRRRIV